MANWRSHRETVHFLGSNMGHFQRFGTTKMRRDFRGVWTQNGTFLHLSRCLQKVAFTGIYSKNRASGWLWLENQDAPQNGQNVHSFPVRTPICHIVPVSRAYLHPLFEPAPSISKIQIRMREYRTTSVTLRRTSAALRQFATIFGCLAYVAQLVIERHKNTRLFTLSIFLRLFLTLIVIFIL